MQALSSYAGMRGDLKSIRPAVLPSEQASMTQISTVQTNILFDVEVSFMTNGALVPALDGTWGTAEWDAGSIRARSSKESGVYS